MTLLARASLKKPFVKTVASVAMASGVAAAAACSNTEVIANPPVIANPAPPECPETKPGPTDACDLPATMSCGYDDCYGSPATQAKCEDGTWSFSSRSCNPPEPATCPMTMPNHGDACSAVEADGGTLNCSYDVGGCPSVASCQDGVWNVTALPCNPPPPACPETTPADGSDCPAELTSVTCTYHDCGGAPDSGADPDDAGGPDGGTVEADDAGASTGPVTTATCEDGKWEVLAPTCNPPPP